MKPLALLAVALVALPAFAEKPKATKPARSGTKNGVPAWLQQELKPIVNKPVVTR